jgi:hypothetical protein
VTSPTEIGAFDHHCSLLSLIRYLDYDYDTIPFSPLFTNLAVEPCRSVVDALQVQPTYVINWRGSPANPHEKYNRCLPLEGLIPLLSLKGVNFISIAQNISSNERRLLKKHGVPHYGDTVDQGDRCFYDSISILRSVAGVVTTDTSLAHLAANLGVPTYVLLTYGCEWRWTQDERTNWYPDTHLVRQRSHGDWDDVVDKMRGVLMCCNLPSE